MTDGPAMPPQPPTGGHDEPRLDVLVHERRRLLSLAYRLTGTLADAEDVVQETYVRWYRLSEGERADVVNLAGWLTRVASRVALDLLGSARARRERYVGQWLPEPVPADLFAGTAPAPAAVVPSQRASVASAAPPPDPLERVTLDESVGTALLVVLESMTPAERVAFVLHDVFAVPFAEIAEIVGRSPAAVRQLATSGRRHVQERRSVAVPSSERDATVRAFLAASRGGDLDALVRVLAPDAQLRSDGGGHVSAAPRVVAGADRVARFMLGVLAKQPALTFEEVPTADGLGYRLRLGDAVYGIATLRVERGRVSDVWLVLNPDKLTAWLPPAP